MTTVSINSTHDSLHLKLHASESLIALFRNSQNSLATAISDVHAFCSFADHTANTTVLKFSVSPQSCLCIGTYYDEVITHYWMDSFVGP